MADKVSKFIFPVKNGTQITNKEFELPGGSSFDGDYNSLTNKPTLGTAAAKNVPSSGNASSSQVVMGNDSRLTDSRNAKDVPSWAKASSKPTYTASEVGAIATSVKGTANGVAELDSTGKVPSSQLPSFVDDTIEGYLYNSKWYKESAHTTEIAGETGKIYVDLSTNKTYRWSGSAFVEISASLALGETSSTAYRGDRGKTAYDHSQSTHARTDATKTEASSTNGNIKINGTETKVYTHPGSGTNPHGTTKSDVGLSNVGNFKAVSTVANQGLTDTEKANARANIGAGTSSFSGSYNDLTDKPTIPSDTKNTAGSTDTSDKIFLVGAKSQAANPQTYSHDTAYVGTDGCLYSGGKKTLTDLPSHNHDDRYYTEEEENDIIDGLQAATSIVQSQVSNSGDAYSSSKAYVVGDLVIYNNTLYRCTTACSAGSWATNQSCFTQDTLTNVANNNVAKSITSIVSGTSAFTIKRAYGYKKGNHYHIEVYGITTSDISSAPQRTFFTFTGVPTVPNNTPVGSFINITNNLTYPTYAVLGNDGYFRQIASGTIANNKEIGFVIDFAI